MYDRVVNVREGSFIPVGLRGTVISVSVADLRSSYSLTVLYDETFAVGDHVTRSFETAAYSLLNLTHGQRKQRQMEQTMPARQFLLRAEPVHA
jgi:Xrn1 SH3-like domain